MKPSAARRAIQRTLILTYGETARRVGAQLEACLSPEQLPPSVVSIVTLTTESPDDTQVAMAEAVQRISQTTAPAQLAAHGWQLDRLHEVNLIIIADMLPPLTAQDLAGWLQAAGQTIQSQLGLEATSLLLALVPERNEPAAVLSAVVQRAERFTRGILLLSRVNEAGLQLEAEVFVATAALFVESLVSTPLRHAPERLTDRAGLHTNRHGLVNSAGLTCWHWSPQAEWEHCARRWVASVLAQWQQVPYETEGGDSQANSWVSDADIVPDRLAETIATLLPPFTLPAWVLPQPWRLQARLQKLTQLGTSLQTLSSKTISLTVDALAPLLAEKDDQLTAFCHQMMNANPVAAAVRAQRFLEAVSRLVDAFLQRVYERQEAQADEAEAQEASQNRLQQRLEALLTCWPQPSAGRWVAALIRPWRWPLLVWHYWQIQQLARELVHHLRQQVRLEHERMVMAVLEIAYETMQAQIKHRQAQVDELQQMLGHLQRQVDAQLKADAQRSPLEALFDTFVDTPGAEATNAAAAVGGLGQQLTRPDDAILPLLMAAGRERLAGIGQLTAADALALLLPDAESQAGWWEQQWLDALPLWPFDETAVTDELRSYQVELAFVVARGVHAFKQWLGPAAQPPIEDGQWLEQPDPERVLLVRLRSGIPVP